MKKTLASHLIDLKKIVLRTSVFFLAVFFISYFYKEDIFKILLKPFIKSLNETSAKEIIYTNLTEAFVTYLQIAFFSSFLLTFTFLLAQIFYFSSPGLKKKERKLASVFVILIPVLMVLGILFSYFYAFDAAWKFFLSFEEKNKKILGIPLVLHLRMEDYISICIQIMIVFAAVFQLPAFLICCNRLKILSVKALRKYRKIVIVLAFAVAAVITPPDAMSQIILALIIIFLYEISILVCLCLGKKQGTLY